MPIRNDHVEWTAPEEARFLQLSAEGYSAVDTAHTLNLEFHQGQPIRTQSSITNRRSRGKVFVGRKVRGVVQPLPPATPEQEVQQTTTESGVEAKAVGSRIKTVEDLLKHIGADLTKFEVAKSEATKYETAGKDAAGNMKVTELHRVFVQLKPKAGPSVLEAVEAIIDGAFAKRQVVTPRVTKSVAADPELMQVLVLADPHIGKYAWKEETGWQDYDIGIASRLIRDASSELIADGLQRKVGRRVLLLLGDYFHYDTPNGATTKGTPLDRDGRVEKMVEQGSQVLFDLIESSAKLGQTEVVLVPGNHDAVLTVALRQILSAEFRRDNRVAIDTRKTSRKYLAHGTVLLGMTHGDKAKRRLGELMAAEVPDLWGRSSYREVHTGHLHHEAEVQTIGGVVIRTAPALCPPDGWHAIEGYVGAPRGMQAFYYHTQKALIGMTVSNPDRS